MNLMFFIFLVFFDQLIDKIDTRKVGQQNSDIFETFNHLKGKNFDTRRWSTNKKLTLMGGVNRFKVDTMRGQQIKKLILWMGPRVETIP